MFYPPCTIVPDLTPIFLTVYAIPTDQNATSPQVRYISFPLCVKIMGLQAPFLGALWWLKFDRRGLHEYQKLAPL